MTEPRLRMTHPCSSTQLPFCIVVADVDTVFGADVRELRPRGI